MESHKNKYTVPPSKGNGYRQHEPKSKGKKAITNVKKKITTCTDGRYEQKPTEANSPEMSVNTKSWPRNQQESAFFCGKSRQNINENVVVT